MSENKAGTYKCNAINGIQIKGSSLKVGASVELSSIDIKDKYITEKISKSQLIYLSPKHEKILAMDAFISSEPIEVIPDESIEVKKKKKKPKKDYLDE